MWALFDIIFPFLSQHRRLGQCMLVIGSRRRRDDPGNTGDGLLGIRTFQVNACTGSLFPSYLLSSSTACRQRWTQRQVDFDQHTLRPKDLRQDLAQVFQQVEELSERVAVIERTRDTSETAWYSARRMQDDVERLAGLANAQDTATMTLCEFGYCA